VRVVRVVEVGYSVSKGRKDVASVVAVSHASIRMMAILIFFTAQADVRSMSSIAAVCNHNSE
jgi:hypothetical protein